MIDMTKISIILITIFLLEGCSFFISENIELIYLHDTPLLSSMELLVFKDKNDSIIFILSQKKDSDTTMHEGFEKLEENNNYVLKLLPIEKGKVLKSIIRGHPNSFISENNKVIIFNDTLIGDVYSSPNIIGKYFKK